MSKGSNWSIQCINGHEIEGETPDTPIENRRPCPKCGTTARTFSMSVIGTMDAVLSPAPIRVDLSFPPPSVGELVEQVAALHTDITLRCYEPSGPNGSWTIQAFDTDGETIAMTEQFEWDDAALSILDQLKPPQDDA